MTYIEPVNFSSRTTWQHQPNALTQALQRRRESGKPVYDLTISNPTDAGIPYPADEILGALAQPESLQYCPQPSGLKSARAAVAEYYAAKNIVVDPTDILLTSSTSEAYSHLFTLLCEAGDNVLIPAPSYPLFEFLAQLSHVRLRPYQLRYDGEWHIDFSSLVGSITPDSKAIIVVSPHNPTGMVLRPEELHELQMVCRRHTLPLIVDEVFLDYPNAKRGNHCVSTAAASDVPTFTLNGISKSCGLPQLKLGWIVVCGPSGWKIEAVQRLEIIADTFLSVNTLVQVALPRLFKSGESIRRNIQRRVEINRSCLSSVVRPGSPLTVLECDAGWCAILRVPTVLTDEEWVLTLLQEVGVLVHPGYFFDFQEPGYLVLSLLPEERFFAEGISLLFRIIEREARAR